METIHAIKRPLLLFPQVKTLLSGSSSVSPAKRYTALLVCQKFFLPSSSVIDMSRTEPELFAVLLVSFTGMIVLDQLRQLRQHRQHPVPSAFPCGT